MKFNITLIIILLFNLKYGQSIDVNRHKLKPTIRGDCYCHFSENYFFKEVKGTASIGYTGSDDLLVDACKTDDGICQIIGYDAKLTNVLSECVGSGEYYYLKDEVISKSQSKREIKGKVSKVTYKTDKSEYQQDWCCDGPFCSQIEESFKTIKITHVKECLGLVEKHGLLKGLINLDNDIRKFVNDFVTLALKIHGDILSVNDNSMFLWYGNDIPNLEKKIDTMKIKPISLQFALNWVKSRENSKLSRLSYITSMTSKVKDMKVEKPSDMISKAYNTVLDLVVKMPEAMKNMRIDKLALRTIAHDEIKRILQKGDEGVIRRMLKSILKMNKTYMSCFNDIEIFLSMIKEAGDDDFEVDDKDIL